ncbi:MAG: YihA family ribosome biogenesis GTP-binding protein [Acidobacteria bacterium]|nr:YihA family ribosome biogenesis GTP-binding protein [Acidobacteriota bacterium]
MSVEFIASAGRPESFPADGLLEVAFVGRSNVGKSSLLNALLTKGKRRKGEPPISKKQLAKTSATPGRTQTINFYKIDGRYYFVDLPGYGFAKAPRSVVNEWKRLAESYLTDRLPLRLVVLIIDSRHGAKDTDEQMREWLTANDVPFLVVASKADKLKPSQRDAAIRAIEESFSPPVAFSAVTGEGVTTLWDGILEALASAS